MGARKLVSEEEDTAVLIRRVRGGDVEAYAGLVRRYQQDVWRVVAFALRDVDASADLAQQAFVNAYTALDRFEEGRDFGVWVRGIARNLVREELRRRGRESKRHDAYRKHLEIVAATDADADAREKALRDALAKCKEELAEPTQRALALRYEEGQRFDGVAEALGRTVAASRQLLQRARIQLRTCIETRMEVTS